MDSSSTSTRSFVFDIDDGVITPVDSEPQTPDVMLNSALLPGSVACPRQDIVLSAFQGPYVAFPPPSRRLARSLCPPPLAPFPSRPISSWFDDTPTQSMFTIDPETIITADSDVQSEWLDDPVSPIYSTFAQRESDKMSTFTFGRGGATSPSESSDSHSCSQSSESHSSSTAVPTEPDHTSSISTKTHPFVPLDEQLIKSPMDSFAAMCWDSAVSDRRRSSISSVSVPELRFSKLYSDTALDYEEQQWKVYSGEKHDSLPHMQFSSDFAPRIFSQEVTPWMYLPEKAISVLDLPSDSQTFLNNEANMSQSFCKKHRRGQISLGAIATKCRRAIGCINGDNART